MKFIIVSDMYHLREYDIVFFFGIRNLKYMVEKLEFYIYILEFFLFLVFIEF